MKTVWCSLAVIALAMAGSSCRPGKAEPAAPAQTIAPRIVEIPGCNVAIWQNGTTLGNFACVLKQADRHIELTSDQESPAFKLILKGDGPQTNRILVSGQLSHQAVGDLILNGTFFGLDKAVWQGAFQTGQGTITIVTNRK